MCYETISVGVVVVGVDVVVVSVELWCVVSVELWLVVGIACGFVGLWV